MFNMEISWIEKIISVNTAKHYDLNSCSLTLQITLCLFFPCSITKYISVRSLYTEVCIYCLSMSVYLIVCAGRSVLAADWVS